MVLNLSAYSFQSMSTDLQALKSDLRDKAHALAVKGTIILATEGININIAGERSNVLALKIYLIERCALEDILFKESESKIIPFRRMKVKLKKEIITFRQNDIQPKQKTVPHLPPETLKRWLDDGIEVILLDTRNNYETTVGHFKQAHCCNIENFTALTESALSKLSQMNRSHPVVTYCTGGVRCEKAGPAIEQLGFKKVYQLEGGILNYFEHCGGTHWQGDCFVFDSRHAVTPSLEPIIEQN